MLNPQCLLCLVYIYIYVWFVISNESMDLGNSEQRTKEFDDPQVFDNPKGISIGSMDYDNPKVYVYTSESRSVLDILRLFDKNFNLHLR